MTRPAGEFQSSDSYELAIPDESCDAVFPHMVLEHVGRLQEALAEMKQVLKRKA